ncbi:3D domain-containing protein [Pareuzebyella sediminis]|uniref:3D domain-containing protein n=1 Tax=Pareuzebyella sediminis TaxID=2607998 RepID=UPI001E40BF69|nr:3D domain-containing protein [Pareuzebyella sediminis]
MKPIMQAKVFIVLVLPFLLVCCGGADKDYIWKNREVTVSAYNSLASQTVGNPSVAAWGDTLVNGMRVVAVSRDLIGLGLGYGTQVKIEGLKGIYQVKDKMHSRYRNRIDVFMGKDLERAKNWGQKKLTIAYRVKRDTIRSK